MSVLKVVDRVRDALAEGRGVVALESTLLAHGMPRDRRLDVAARLGDEVRALGAEPAVIAVMHGSVRVGLDEHEIEELCTTSGVTKTGERDLAWALRGGVHATTVSSTLWAAVRAGIRVFATGGIGGVHRGAELTWDESQDLQSLARHPVALISAGAKAILDLPKTVERLESLGVLVVGYQCSEFPAFYCANSGIPLEHSVQRVDELAALMTTRFVELAQGGVLVCNPVGRVHELPREDIERAIAAAVSEADTQRIEGKALTPFLLQAMERITGGRSVETNIALATGNARLGAALAIALAAPGIEGSNSNASLGDV